MSMSQEEIEALMSGADDISGGDEESSDDSVGAIDNDILAGIEGITDDEPQEEESSNDNIDDILAGIEGITDDEPQEEIPTQDDSAHTIEEMIEESKFPLPVEKEHKVVNQLNEVAEDSEEKASQIFDILSFILDENGEVGDVFNQLEEFATKQRDLLTSLENKFPNIDVFKDNLEESQKSIEIIQAYKLRIDAENNKIFEAMEIMQYHDINRQKIERVMAVIKKLTNYLNGIFEDDTGKPEVQIAKHISGDSASTVSDDDLESLIGEFSNN